MALNDKDGLGRHAKTEYDLLCRKLIDGVPFAGELSVQVLIKVLVHTGIIRFAELGHQAFMAKGTFSYKRMARLVGSEKCQDVESAFKTVVSHFQCSRDVAENLICEAFRKQTRVDWYFPGQCLYKSVTVANGNSVVMRYAPDGSASVVEPLQKVEPLSTANLVAPSNPSTTPCWWEDDPLCRADKGMVTVNKMTTSNKYEKVDLKANDTLRCRFLALFLAEGVTGASQQRESLFCRVVSTRNKKAIDTSIDWSFCDELLRQSSLVRSSSPTHTRPQQRTSGLTVFQQKWSEENLSPDNSWFETWGNVRNDRGRDKCSRSQEAEAIGSHTTTDTTAFTGPNCCHQNKAPATCRW